MSIPVFHALTYQYNCLPRKLITSVKIISGEKETEINALWDTGATGTCISREVVQQLELIPTGMMTIQTASGTEDVNTYAVNIILPNNVGVQGVPVCDSAIGEQGIGMLVGMDIIQMGDFSVTNVNKKTVFTFRIPSVKTVNYAEEADMIRLAGSHGKGKRKRK